MEENKKEDKHLLSPNPIHQKQIQHQQNSKSRSPSQIKRTPFCKLHHEPLLHEFCQTCNQFLCNSCLQNHHNHQLQYFTGFDSFFIQQLEDFQVKIQIKKSYHQSTLKRLEQELENIEQNCDVEIQTIQYKLNELIKDIVQKQQEIIDQVQLIYQQKNLKLEKQIKTIETESIQLEKYEKKINSEINEQNKQEFLNSYEFKQISQFLKSALDTSNINQSLPVIDININLASIKNCIKLISISSGNNHNQQIKDQSLELIQQKKYNQSSFEYKQEPKKSKLQVQNSAKKISIDSPQINNPLDFNDALWSSYDLKSPYRSLLAEKERLSIETKSKQNLANLQNQLNSSLTSSLNFDGRSRRNLGLEKSIQQMESQKNKFLNINFLNKNEQFRLFR